MGNQATSRIHEISPAIIFARPTAENLWLGPTQRLALSHLSVRQPVTVLLGPRASGRTTLLQRLAHETADAYRTLTASGGEESATRVIRALLTSAGFDCTGLELTELRRLLDVFIDERLSRDGRLRIAIDDADRLEPDAIREIEDLRRRAGSRQAAPELVLSLVHVEPGSSPAADFIRALPSPGLVVLTWLSSNEVGWYLSWRLERFGFGGVITSAAVRQIELSTRGCFASINHICQLALLLMRQRNLECVDPDLVQDALDAHNRLRATGRTDDRPSRKTAAVSAA